MSRGVRVIVSRQNRCLPPREAFDAVLVRLKDINPKINAVVLLDIPTVQAASDASTARWRRGTPLGALDGVPLTVKDNKPVARLRPAVR